MPSFDSPLGKQNIPANPALKNFDVPDDSRSTLGPQTQNANILNQNYQSNTAQPRPVPQFDEAAFAEFQARMQPPPPQQVRELSQYEQEMLQAKKLQREGKTRLSDGARKRIELLIGMTRLSKTIDIEGTTFTFQTLRSKELREALVSSSDFDGTVQFSFEYSKQLLARALTHIAGEDIAYFLSSNELEDKLMFVENLPHALFTRLYNEYVDLDTQARDKFGVKTENKVKEVIADLGK